MISSFGDLFALLVLVGLIFLALSWPRWASKRHWLRKVYRAVDEDLGIRRFINDRRATKRHNWYRGIRVFSLGAIKKEAAASFVNFWFPHVEFGGVGNIMALPGIRTRGKFVHIEFKPKPWPGIYTKKDMLAWRLTWTTETNPFGIIRRVDFVTALEQDLCKALDLVWFEGIFSVFDHRIERYIRPGEETFDRYQQLQGPGKLEFRLAQDASIKVPGELRGEALLPANGIGDDTEEMEA